MNKEELIKNQFPNDEFLQAAVLRIVDKCVAELEKENAELKKNCEEYSKTFNRQNDEIVSLREKMIKAKEIIRSLYFIIQGRIDYKGNIPLEDEMYRAKQFLQEVSE